VTAACETVTLRHTGEALRGNPLHDPVTRDVVVITPPGYDQSDRAYPVVFWLAGFGSAGKDFLASPVLGESLPERLTRAMRSGQVADALVVLPDCSTRYGGSQYLDTPGCGRYQAYLADELIPFVDRSFRTLGPGRRAIGGKSSGGYGALLMAMRRPGLFDTVIAHSPDAGFEWCYLSLLPGAMDTIRARGGWTAFEADPRAVTPKDGAFMVAMSLVAMAACYAAAPGRPLSEAFPCDPGTGCFRDDVWGRWLGHDPVRLASSHAEQLRELRTLHLDAGIADEYAMHWGARALHESLDRAGVRHRYQEHAGGHHGIEHLFVRSLAFAGQRWQDAEEGRCAASLGS
jgi:S-formylglutathione hydrolase FrmB